MSKSKKAKKPPTTKVERRKTTDKSTASKLPEAARAQAPTKKTQPPIRESSKLATVIAILRSPKGATIEALSNATGWQEHSVRGALSGAIKRKLGLTVTSDKTDGVRTYRIAK